MNVNCSTDISTLDSVW